MKKILIASALLLSVAAINASVGNDRTKQLNDEVQGAITYRDTVPGDTTKPDTATFAMAYRVVRDTVPSDTTKPDSTFQHLAIVK